MKHRLHTRTRCWSVFSPWLGVLLLTMMMLAGTASGQTPRYRVTPLVNLNLPINEFARGTAGINNKGQVVYQFVPQGGSQAHAWIWLPAPDYLLPAGFTDLTRLTNSPTPAIPRDISMNGYVVGQARYGFAEWSGVGAVWNLTPFGTYTYTELGTFPAQNPWSGAFAVNDENPPIIVGDSSVLGWCYCGQPGDPYLDNRRAFWTAFTGPDSTLNPLSPAPDLESFARDVRTRCGGALPCTEPLDIAGFISCIEIIVESCADPLSCERGKDAVAWPNGIILQDFSLGGSETHGINAAGECVGWAYLDQNSPCRQRATYWPSPTQLAVPFNLGQDVPNNEQSRAEAINNLSLPQVVGWNTDQGGAYLWEKLSNGLWSFLDLNLPQAIGGCSSRWVLSQAHDINDFGWIITIGQNTGNEWYALLLTPFPNCPADVTHDNCVNNNDLLAVINAWGDCRVGRICDADVTGDCTVGGSDVTAVIAAWCGPPCPAPCCTGCPPSQCGGGALSAPPTQAQLVELVLQSSHPPAIQLAIIHEILQQ